MLWIGLGALFCCAQEAVEKDARSPSLSHTTPLRTALEIRYLSREQAEAGPSVEMRGVVTFSDPPGTVFVQDDTAGAFFRLEGKNPPNPGDEVEIRGIIAPGLYLPGISQVEFRVTGHPGLPDAPLVSYEELLSGRYHYQRVSVEGIVRSIAPAGENITQLSLDLGARVLPIRIETSIDSAPDLIDARLRISGLAAGQLNDRAQLVLPYLRCRDWDDCKVLQPAQAVADISSVTPAEILTFAAGGSMRNRVRLSGVVTAAFEEGKIYLRSDGVGIGIHLPENLSDLQEGDELEVLGFPQMERLSAALVDCVPISHQSGNDAPQPTATTTSQLVAGANDNDLVSLETRVLQSYQTESGTVLAIGDGQDAIRAESIGFPLQIEPKTLVRITGIAITESAKGTSVYRVAPDRIRIRLRHPEDLAILRAPPWWTAARLGGALIVTLAVAALAGLWILLLRRQVRLQTRSLTRQIEREAVLEERQRLAREFHDTLEQQLVGLTLRLDVASVKSRDSALQDFLTGIRRLVLGIQTETRNIVSDLRESGASDGSLITLLTEVTQNWPQDSEPRIVVDHCSDALPTLPSRTIHHLRMIVQEAITNAMKHAKAKEIRLRLARSEKSLSIEIEDDGTGFNTDAKTSGSLGHYGCMGMRERCRAIGAAIHWQSSADSGTTVTVTLPFE